MMKFDEMWNRRPEKGKSIIYRYFEDDRGQSYIGVTTQSLRERAGGKQGSRYLRERGKFGFVIDELGFDSFQYEILEEVECAEVKTKKAYYIKKFDSRKNGYNGKLREEFIIHLSDFSKEQKRSLYHNFSLLARGVPDTKKTIDEAISFFAKSNITVEYGYYAFEGETYVVTLNPILLFANFFDLMCSEKFESMDEMSEYMLEDENLGGDLLTSGDFDRVKIKLSNGESITIKISYTARYE